MKKFLQFVILIIIILPQTPFAYAQSTKYKVMFYNAENYFDPFDDPATLDNDFTPEGSYHWTWGKFTIKRNFLSKVIIAVGGGKMPVLLGMCEIENRLVLNQLVRETGLAKYDYKIVHRDSPDARGIDVALLHTNDFKVIGSSFYAVSNEFKTREILYAKGILANADTLHVFVCHFPSKLGGAKASEDRRMTAAAKLKSVCDSIKLTNISANIIVMGDFNDTPDSRPITEGLSASSNFENKAADTLYNLALPLAQKGRGTLKYQGVWEIIDLMFVSGNMFSSENKIYCTSDDFKIFEADFLMEPDKAFTGSKPKRTFIGMKYNGGISDHLPVFLNLDVKNE